MILRPSIVSARPASGGAYQPVAINLDGSTFAKADSFVSDDSSPFIGAAIFFRARATQAGGAPFWISDPENQYENEFYLLDGQVAAWSGIYPSSPSENYAAAGVLNYADDTYHSVVYAEDTNGNPGVALRGKFGPWSAISPNGQIVFGIGVTDGSGHDTSETWISTDAGATWTQMVAGVPAEVLAHPGRPAVNDAGKIVVPVSSSNSVYVFDSGTWTQVATGSAFPFGVVTMSNDGQKVTGVDSNLVFAWLSTDGGTTWARLTGANNPAVSADGSRIVAIYLGKLSYSTDDGATWHQSATSCSSAYDTMAVSNNGMTAFFVPFVSLDGGATWTDRSGPDYRGANWRSSVTGDGTTLIADIVPVASSDDFLHTSVDGGATWVNSGTRGGSSPNAGGNTVYANGTYTGGFLSTDKGQNFSPLLVSNTPSTRKFRMLIDRIDVTEIIKDEGAGPFLALMNGLSMWVGSDSYGTNLNDVDICNLRAWRTFNILDGSGDIPTSTLDLIVTPDNHPVDPAVFTAFMGGPGELLMVASPGDAASFFRNQGTGGDTFVVTGTPTIAAPPGP